jgi:hypothetical protein
MIKGSMGGADQVVSTIKKIAGKFPDRVAKAIYQEAQIEMTEAKRRTPVSPTPAPKGVVPGALRASGTVHEPRRSGNDIHVQMSFGNSSIDYAIVQHENLDYHHTTGQAKYLESVLNESRPHMAARIAKRISLNNPDAK